MYFFHCEETKPLVSIFTYIDTIFLFLRSLVPFGPVVCVKKDDGYQVMTIPDH